MQLWFTEEDDKTIRLGYRVEDVLYRERSEFQMVEVLDTSAYGKMLVIDGFVMTTEADEFVYHEMIAHVPLCLHKDPRQVLVIGGGDGGTIREVLRHDTVERAVLCEIDEKVVEASRQFLPSIAGKLDDPRCEVRIGDGVAFIKEHTDAFDVIIIDSTDPIGPGEGLFSREFYKSVANALKSDGLMVAQSESPWYAPEILQRIQRNIRGGFEHAAPYLGSVPTYPRGLWSWTLAANHPINPTAFDRRRLEAFADELKYLTPELLPGAFALPPFVAKKFQV